MQADGEQRQCGQDEREEPQAAPFRRRRELADALCEARHQQTGAGARAAERGILRFGGLTGCGEALTSDPTSGEGRQ
jgi:hypothetical protein